MVLALPVQKRNFQVSSVGMYQSPIFSLLAKTNQNWNYFYTLFYNCRLGPEVLKHSKLMQ